MKKELTITPVMNLSEIAKGELVELPGWTDDAPFVARLRRASLSGMIRAGKIPNPLMAAAQRLYEGGSSRASAPFHELIEVQRLVVGEALAEPSEAVLRELGLELTEQQIQEIYTYALRGPKALEQFRALAQNRDVDSHGDAEPDTPE